MHCWQISTANIKFASSSSHCNQPLLECTVVCMLCCFLSAAESILDTGGQVVHLQPVSFKKQHFSDLPILYMTGRRPTDGAPSLDATKSGIHSEKRTCIPAACGMQSSHIGAQLRCCCSRSLNTHCPILLSPLTQPPPAAVPGSSSAFWTGLVAESCL